MKKFAMIAIAAALAVVMAFSFVACNVEVNLNATVSEVYPENITPTVAINGDMSATEMLAAAIENYYGTDFAIARTTGSLTTKVMEGAITLTQFVKSVTIRDGASDADNKLFYQRFIYWWNFIYSRWMCVNVNKVFHSIFLIVDLRTKF